MKTFTVWLVIRIGVLGEPVMTVEDTVMPDLDSCLARSSEILKKAADITDGYNEFFVTCSIAREPSDPA